MRKPRLASRKTVLSQLNTDKKANPLEKEIGRFEYVKNG